MIVGNIRLFGAISVSNTATGGGTSDILVFREMFDFDMPDNSNGYHGYTIRQVIPASAVQFGGTEVKISIKADTDNGIDIDKVYIGQRDTGYAFDGAPTEVLFGGSSGVSIAAGAESYSDTTTFTITSGDDLVISMYCNPAGTGPGDFSAQANPTDFEAYFKNADEAIDIAPTGFTTAIANLVGVSKIEVGNDVPPPAVTLSDAFAYDYDANSNDWVGYTMRQVIDSTEIAATGNKVRVYIEADGDQGFDLGNAYVGIKSTSGDAYDFESTPVQLTFGGSNSVYIPAGARIQSDIVDLTVGASDGLVVSVYCDGAATEDDLRAKSSQSGFYNFQKNANDAATVDANGYSSSASDIIGVMRVEIGGDSPVSLPSSTRWRILGSRTLGTDVYDTITFAELELLDNSLSSIDTTGTTITDSGNFSASENGAKLFDGDLATRWATPRASSTEDAWVEIEFVSSTEVAGFRLNTRHTSNNNSEFSPIDLKLQYWDGSSWQTFIERTDYYGWYQNGTTNGIWTRLIGGSKGRLWRLRMTDSEHGSYLGLEKIEFRTTTGVAETHGTGVEDQNARASTYWNSPNSLSESVGYAFDSSSNHWGGNLGAIPISYCDVEYQFDTLKDVEELYLLSRSGSPTHAPSDFEVAYSDDGGTTWTTIKTVVGEPTWSNAEARTYSIP